MGKYVIKKGKKIHFVLKANNGQIIGTSESYESEKACTAGIASVIKNAPVAKISDTTDENAGKVSNPKFEIYKDKKGDFRFRLLAKNGENILSSEGYTAKTGCKKGIDSVIKNADSPTVEE